MKSMKTRVILTVAGVAFACTPFSQSIPVASMDKGSNIIVPASASEVVPCEEPDETDDLCYTFPSEKTAKELYKAYGIDRQFPSGTEVIYMGYTSQYPQLGKYEGYVSDGDKYYVFSVFTDSSLYTA